MKQTPDQSPLNEKSLDEGLNLSFGIRGIAHSTARRGGGCHPEYRPVAYAFRVSIRGTSHQYREAVGKRRLT